MTIQVLNKTAQLRISSPCLIDTPHGARVFRITATDANGRIEAVRFEIPRDVAIEPAPSIRTSVLAFLLPAMRSGATLVLDEPLDAQTYQNLMEYQAAVAAWQPKQLRKIAIEAAVEAIATPRALTLRPAALASFSGGVDSCHTLWTHRPGAPSLLARQAELRAALMVHGLDIPVEQSEIFAAAFERSRQILQSQGVVPLQLRTDIRRLESAFGVTWSTQAHGMFLAACLSVFEKAFDVVLIPSTYVYAALKFPWGSNPIGDPLFGGAGVAYWHDGAAFLKHEKVGNIAADSAVQKYLRVCWEGDSLDRNCGRCFKCMATQVAFWCAGIARPESFDQSCSLHDLKALPIKNEQNFYLIENMRDHALRVGREDIAAVLDVALRRSDVDSPVKRKRIKTRIFALLGRK